MTAPAGLALFVCGVLAHLAWRSGLYGNAALAALVGVWLVAATLWRQRAAQAVVVAPLDRAAAVPHETRLRRLQTMLDQAPAPLMTVGGDGALHAANRAARQLFRTDDRVPDPPPSLQDALERVRPGERAVLKLRLASSDAPRSYALQVAGSVGPDGDAVQLVLLTDIQAELQAAEAGALRDLLQMLSHEIMNSLTPVTSLAESAHALLTSEDAVARETIGLVADALETILRRARGLDRFVQGYRTLARLPPPVLRPYSLSRLLEEAAALFRIRWARGGPPFRLYLPASDLILRLDPDLLVQALLNLLANAAEAALANTARPPNVTLSGFAQGDGAAIHIADSGLGVLPEHREAIFRPFFTSKPAGTGLGLGLAREIANSHGGSLILEEPQDDCGASFLLTLS